MRAELIDVYRPIEGHLATLEDLVDRELVSEEPFLREFLDHFSRYGGKRVRPALLFLFGRALGEIDEGHIKVAAAAELVHVATLIHDDILDEAAIRRQRTTVNRLFGNERAVLLGDWVFTKAFEIVSRMEDARIMQRLVTTSREVCQGEMLQICHRCDFTMGEERYLELVRMKTGALFAFCCEMGAYLSGVTGPLLEACRRYGENLGVAFQIVDDCLDVTGREDVVGKSLGTDLAKGKMTLPILRALDLLDGEERRTLETVFAGDARKGEVLQRLEAVRAVDYSREKAKTFTEQAKVCLEAIDGRPLRRQMEHLADFVLNRHG